MTAYDTRASVIERRPTMIAPTAFDRSDEMEAVRQGDLEVRLARSETEVLDAQRLRYRIFYEEISSTRRWRRGRRPIC